MLAAVALPRAAPNPCILTHVCCVVSHYVFYEMMLAHPSLQGSRRDMYSDADGIIESNPVVENYQIAVEFWE
jgi:hypothetical protein